MTIFWKCNHPQAIEDVDEFISSSEQIWRIWKKKKFEQT